MKNLSKKFKLLGGIILSIIILTAFSVNNKRKVTICHKGKVTLSISANALQAHLNHGDHIGLCRRPPVDER